MNNKKIELKDILNYTFYDENHKLNVVLNENYIKELFNANIVLLKETEHK